MIDIWFYNKSWSEKLPSIGEDEYGRKTIVISFPFFFYDRVHIIDEHYIDYYYAVVIAFGRKKESPWHF